MNKGVTSRDIAITVYGAVEQPDGSYIHPKGYIMWYNEAGQSHKEDAPAIMYPNGNVSWCYKGLSYSFNTWLSLSSVSDEEKMMLRLQYG
jgi:hypothetical protein